MSTSLKMKKIRVRLKMPSTHMVAGKARIPTYIFNFLQYLLPTIKEKNCFFLMQCKTKFLMILHLPITICCNDAGKATKISDSAFANCKIWQWLKHISLQHEVPSTEFICMGYEVFFLHIALHCK
jgi:hypothetical protein